MNRRSGFTVIELVVVAVILGLAAILVFTQINNLQSTNRDQQRKTAINSMYYALEEIYYKDHKAYPESLSAGVLPSVDPALFTDPDGFTLGANSVSEDELVDRINSGKSTSDDQRMLSSLAGGKTANYKYESTDCDNDGKCKSYTLSADLEREARYTKTSRHN